MRRPAKLMEHTFESAPIVESRASSTSRELTTWRAPGVDGQSKSEHLDACVNVRIALRDVFAHQTRVTELP